MKLTIGKRGFKKITERKSLRNYNLFFLTFALGHCGKSTASARVVLVATHADLANCQRSNISGEYVSTEADAILEAARIRFGHVFDVHDSVYVMDAHVVGSQSMKSLKQYLTNAKNLITQVSFIIKIFKLIIALCI